MKRCLSYLSALLFCFGTGFGQQFDLRIDNRNALWASPPVVNNDPFFYQFGAVAPTAAGVATSPRETPTASNLTIPGSAPTGRLIRSIIGGSVSGRIPDLFFGDAILPPAVEYEGVAINLQSRPLAFDDPSGLIILTDLDVVRPGAGGGGGTPVQVNPVASPTPAFYYSPHMDADSDAAAVIASQSGVIELYWISENVVEGTSARLVVKQSLLVSASPRGRPKTVYWTEGNGLGIEIEVPEGVRDVNILYNQSLPETVGALDPLAPNAHRTLWFEQGQIRAQNSEGRVIMEFLGATRGDGSGAREFLGYEVVDVRSETRPALVETYVGDLLQPSQALPDLLPRPVRPTSNLFASYPRRDGRGNDYYAVQTNDMPQNLLMYWTEPGVAGTRWPRLLDAHRITWPDALDAYAPNVVLDANTPAVLLPQGNIAELVFQDDPLNGEAAIQNQSAFIVNLGADQENRSLIRFQLGDRVWFQRVLSQSSELPLGGGRASWIDRDADGIRDFSTTVEVGQRIEPPIAGLSPAGYINQAVGNAFNPGAYRDPFAERFASAAQGAIIPVNALAGNDTLEVWWFAEIAPPFPEFAPVMWPAYVGRYTAEWPAPGEALSLLAEGDTTLVEQDPNLVSGASTSLLLDETDQRFAILSFPLTGLPADSSRSFVLNLMAGTFNRTVHSETEIDVYLVNLEPWDEATFDFATFNADPRNGLLLGTVPAEDIQLVTAFQLDISDALRGYLQSNALPEGLLTIALVPRGQKPYDAVNDPFPNMTTLEIFSSEIFPPEFAPSLTTIGRDVGIVLASNQGSGPLPEPLSTGSIYTQNNPQLPGYNPNEEHALMLGGTAWALRDDLNLPTSSEPFVLLDYIAEDGRPAMALWPVRRELDVNGDGDLLDAADIAFRFDARAGTIVQAPMPLPILHAQQRTAAQPYYIADTDSTDPAPVNARETPLLTDYDSFVFHDRKGTYWVKRGTHDPTENLLLPEAEKKIFRFGFRYPVQEGFYFPDQATQPDLSAGQVLAPYLRPSNPGGGFVGDSLTADPLWVDYVPYWGDLTPPELGVGDTLTTTRFGLPDIINQSSVDIAYDGALATDTRAQAWRGAFLWDPLQFKFAPDLTFADSAATEIRNQRTFVQSLGPELQDRFYFESPEFSAGRLVLEGRFIDAPTGADWLLPNTLTAAEADELNALINGSLPSTAGSAFGQRIDVTATNLSQPPANGGAAFASFALTSLGDGHQPGFLTLVYGNSAQSPDDEPVSMEIIYVGPRVQQPELVTLYPENPLSERVSLRMKNDFGGNIDSFEYDWRYAPPNGDGTVPFLASEDAFSANPSGWLDFNADSNQVTISGASIFTLTDNYFIVRFRAVDPDNLSRRITTIPGGWSEWSRPQLVEGWIKRVLGGINPFQQRTSDFFNNPINTSTSIIAQAGPRWEGNIALSLENIEAFGLIEIYETVANRGKDLSIDGSPAINYGPANDALLLVAGYLNDLYMQLGNEAFADAANPTIAIDATAGEDADVATSLFAFQGQVASLLEEELALLRGRDDSLAPAIDVSPAYNRLYWNFTGGIASGEPIYALNYNIREIAGPAEDGSIDAFDAQRLYPQGHGDAYGHYLTALKNYYDLLADSEFTWVPRIEAVEVLGQPVSIDYQDERKLAAAAAAVSRTAYQILDLTQRQSYRMDSAQGWSHLSERKVNAITGRSRNWSVDDWGARGIQGAYFNWLTGNSIVPAEDSVNTGIQRVDRSTLPELGELAANARAMQNVLDGANTFQNPLGLANNVVTFDIDPSAIKEGITHFEQIYGRAERALSNASSAFSRARSQSAHLRSQEEQIAELERNVVDEERSFNYELVELYGRPYTGDVGPGRVYPQGYDGPDLVNFRFIDETALFVPRVTTSGSTTAPYVYTIDIEDRSVVSDFNNPNFFTPAPSEDASADPSAQAIASFPLNVVDLVDSDGGASSQLRFTIPDDDRFFVVSASDGRGTRPSVGLLQSAYLERIRAKQSLEAALDSNENEKYFLDRQFQLFEARVRDFAQSASVRNRSQAEIEARLDAIAVLKSAALIANTAADSGLELAFATAATVPLAVDDVFSSFRGTIRGAGFAAYIAAKVVAVGAEISAIGVEANVDELFLELEAELEAIGFGAERRQMVYDLELAFNALASTRFEINRALAQLAQSEQEITRLLLRGERLQAEREAFRRRAAATIQGFRTNDLAFRLFRNEALEQYKKLYDLAARYTFLAAKAYDYETGLLGTEAGQAFLSEIVQSRALGVIRDGQPEFAGSQNGDPGLSGLMAKMDGDWSVIEGRLGFNNPDTYGTTFSLRSELFRILGAEESDHDWRAVLESFLVDDLLADPDVAAGALQLSRGEGIAVPGFIIPFSTEVQPGRNFFGRPLAAGDSAYSASSFATKIHSVGIVFEGYKGMDPFYFDYQSPTDEPRINFDPDALSATPYVYLLPHGTDVMRSPPLGDASVLRAWDVFDQALPLPFDLGANDLANGGFIQSSQSLIENPFSQRKHQAFRAVDHAAFFFTRIPDDFTSSRLIGRSVWNTEWKLVIPAHTLLNDEEEAIGRFLNSVYDIKLHLKTYSYSGN